MANSCGDTLMKPLFQKRHYEVVAECFRTCERGHNTFTGDHVIIKLINEFKKDNPKFNEAKFWAAVEGK
jgi:hypothetical protein